MNRTTTNTPPANSQGRVVVEIPAGTFKNNLKVSSHSAVFDTRSPETPAPEIQSVDMPEGIQTEPFDAIGTFDRAVTGVEADAFVLDAPTGTIIVSVTRVGQTNAYTVRISPPANILLSLVTLRLVGSVVDAA